MDKPNTKEVISVKNLNVRFGDFKAIIDASFEIYKGEITIILGPNGSGKTTLIKSLLNLVDYEGSVSIFGKLHEEMSKEDWSRIGYVPQQFNVPRNFPITVKEMLNLSLKITSLGYDEKVRRIVEFIKLEHLEKLQNKIIGELSGGEIQRVLIARALLNLPELIIFDEPLAGIDVVGERTFYEFISYIRTEYKITVVLVSHDVSSVSKIADKVMGINRKIVFFGKPKDVLSIEQLKDIYGENIGIFRHNVCPEEGPCELYKEREES